MKILAEMMGGSRAYGLETPTSDLDIRGVFANDTLENTIGLDRFEHLDDKSDNDKVYYEFRHYMNLLRKTNTTVLEILFNEEWTWIDPQFKSLILDNKISFLDTERFYKSLKGYIHNERKLALGERTGLLGSKRKATLQLYGFSPKNFVQLLRLTTCGSVFFLQGFFPVNIKKHIPHLAEALMDLKLHPEEWKRDMLDRLSQEYEAKMDHAFENRKFDYKFDMKAANQACLEVYRPIINGL